MTNRPPREGLLGIHHITVVAGAAQENLDFYTRVLGLKFIKKTVNFDDPGTYHFYFGDETGSPGTLMTSFPYGGAGRGRHGAGQAVATVFSVPAGSLDAWQRRLQEHGVAVERIAGAFGEERIALTDPHGLGLELAAHTGEGPSEPWAAGPVPPEQAIRGFRGVTLHPTDAAASLDFLVGVLGFEEVAEDDGRIRLALGEGRSRVFVDLLAGPSGSGAPRGIMGPGTHHHVAFRVAGDAAQAAWRERLAEAGTWATPVQERCYFRSIYFREPGGVLFEIATDPPGMLIDETVETLGFALRLPPWLENARPAIEAALPQVVVGDGPS